MYVVSCLLLCCIFEGSKKLRIYIMTKTKAAIYISFYIVELAISSEQKLYFCYDSSDLVFTWSEYDSNQDNRHRTSPTPHPFCIVGLCKVGLERDDITGYIAHCVWLKQQSRLSCLVVYFQSFTMLLRMLV